MTTPTNNKRPTHTLFVKSEDFKKPLNIKLAASWEHANGDGFNFSLEELTLQIDKNKNGTLVPSLSVNTKIYGQPVEVEIAKFEPMEDNKFKVTLGDIVLFKNRYNDNSSSKPKTDPKP